MSFLVAIAWTSETQEAAKGGIRKGGGFWYGDARNGHDLSAVERTIVDLYAIASRTKSLVIAPVVDASRVPWVGAARERKT